MSGGQLKAPAPELNDVFVMYASATVCLRMRVWFTGTPLDGCINGPYKYVYVNLSLPVGHLLCVYRHIAFEGDEEAKPIAHTVVAGKKNARVRWWASSPKGAIILTSRVRA